MTGFLSPNFTARRGGHRPSLIVIHYTAMQSCEAARARLCDPLAEVSAHWLISEQGAAEALVDEAQRAWHAGQSFWRGRDDINSHSIGIELANNARAPFPEPQMAALEQLLRGIMTRWNIAPAGVLAHSDIAPGRKIDPGLHFDWQRLERQGLALARPIPVAPEPGDDFRSLACRIGYAPAAGDGDLLQAFRLRWRQSATGPLAPGDLALAAALARFDVDVAGAGA